MKGNFLAINKEHLGRGLRSVDIMILAQIEEFQRNQCDCYVTNQQFADMFGESESTIKRSVKRLEDMNVINRNTTFVGGNGKGNRRRLLEVNRPDKWKIQYDFTEMEGSENAFGRVKSDEWKDHNGPIKNKEKDKIKDNIYNKNSFGLFISFDQETQEDIDCGLSFTEDWENLCHDVFKDYIEEGYTSFEVENNVIYCLDNDGLAIGSYDVV